MITTKETPRIPQRRAVEVLDFGVEPAPPDRDITGDLSRNLMWNIAEHPATQAMLAARREQAARPPHEQSETYKTLLQQIRALLADTPKETRQALAQARKRFAEVDAALVATDAELERIRAERPTDLAKLDTWSRESGAASVKRDRLLEMHADVAGVLAAARADVLRAMQQAALQRATVARRGTQEARVALRRAQAALGVAHVAEQAAQSLVCRVRDQGLSDPCVKGVLEGA